MKRKFKVMVNNSININKTNNHLTPQTIEYKKKTTTYGVGNPGPSFGQAKKSGRIKPGSYIGG